MGAFAGSPYLRDSAPSDEAIYQETLRLADAGRIDPVENMRADQVYIFHGTLDSIVPLGRASLQNEIGYNVSILEMASRIKNFYSRFMDEDHIELKDDIEAEHGFVRHFHIHQIYIHHLIINSPLLMMAASARS